MKNATSKRILIFNVNWIGDVLFSTAVIRNLRYRFPGSFIACAIPPRCLPVLEANPYLDEIIVFDEKGMHKGIVGKISFIAGLRSRRFDTVYLLHRSFSRALIAFLSSIPERIGYYTRKRGWLLTRKSRPPDIFAVHRAEYYLGLLRQSGIPVRDDHLDFPVSKEHREKARSALSGFCREGDFLIGVNPGGNWLPKRWPSGNFAELVQRLVREFPAKVIITGGPEDAALAGKIKGQLGERVLSLCGQSGLKEFGALCGLLDVFITADSGPLHIACACGARNVIALFGPTDPRLTGPLRKENVIILQKPAGCGIPCYRVDCPDNRCMKAISVDEVVEQVSRVYNNAPD